MSNYVLLGRGVDDGSGAAVEVLFGALAEEGEGVLFDDLEEAAWAPDLEDGG